MKPPMKFPSKIKLPCRKCNINTYLYLVAVRKDDKFVAYYTCPKCQTVHETHWLYNCNGDPCVTDYQIISNSLLMDENVERVLNVSDEEPQKAKADAGKPKLSLVPRRIIYDIAAIREYGNNKYPEGGPDNWKKVEVGRYRDAAFRHFLAYLDDPSGLDEESGLPSLWHLACNIAFLCEMEDKKFGER